MKVLDDTGEPANVVAMGVSQYNHVKMIKAAPPKIGRDHILSKVKFTVHRPDAASTINEHGGAVRRDHKDGISLADINYRNLKYPVVL